MNLKSWRKISVASEEFDALMAALDRAESKGYLPDAIAEEWEAFQWEEIYDSEGEK